jgi:serine/threonine protein kinase
MSLVDNSFVYDRLMELSHTTYNNTVTTSFNVTHKVSGIFVGILENNILAMKDYFFRALQENQTVTADPIYGANRYRRISKVGFGSFSDVYSALDILTNEMVAIKVGKLYSPHFLNLMKKECVLQDVLSRGGIESVLKVRDCYIDTNEGKGNSVCIVMKLLPSPNLNEKYIKPSASRLQMPVEKILDIGRKTLVAIKTFAKIGFLHADLKTSNMSDENGLTILDFGSCISIKPEHKNYFLGFVHTRGYRSPEAILHSSLSEKSDMWSLGVVLFELYTHTKLFHVYGADTLETERNDLRLMVELFSTFPPQEMIDASYNGYYKNFLTRIFNNSDWDPDRWELVKGSFPIQQNDSRVLTIEKRMSNAYRERYCLAMKAGIEYTEKFNDVNKLILIVKSLVAYKRPSIDDAIAMF